LGLQGRRSGKVSELIFTESCPGIQAIRRPARLWLKVFRLSPLALRLCVRQCFSFSFFASRAFAFLCASASLRETMLLLFLYLHPLRALRETGIATQVAKNRVIW
jgi:hypothetical protein